MRGVQLVGLAFADAEVVAPSEAEDAAERLGFPLVAKAIAPVVLAARGAGKAKRPDGGSVVWAKRPGSPYVPGPSRDWSIATLGHEPRRPAPRRTKRTAG